MKIEKSHKKNIRDTFRDRRKKQENFPSVKKCP